MTSWHPRPPVEPLPREVRHARAAVFAICATLLLLLSPAVAVPSEGLFTQSNPNASVISAATLQPPTDVLAAGLSPNAVEIDWTPTASSFAISCELYRSNTSGGPFTLVTTMPPAQATYTDVTGLAGTTHYYYALRCSAQSWMSGYSIEADAWTL